MAVGKVTITVDADSRTFEEQLTSIGHRAGRKAGKQYGDSFCKEASKRIRKCLDKSIGDTDKRFGKAGDKSGKAFAGKFGSSMTKRMRLILGAIVALAEPLAAIVQGAAGAFTALAGSLYKAVAAGGALIPILAGLGASLGAVVIGSQGMGTAFKAISSEWKKAAQEGRKFNMQSKEIQKALKTLTPSARKTAEAFGRMQKPMDDLRRSTQEALFKGMAGVLDRISKQILPELSVGFTKMATSANKFAKGFVTMLEGFDLGKLIGGLAPTMDKVYASFTNFSSGFLTFVSAATPAAEVLATRFENMSKSFKEMVERGKESGAINEFLMDAQIHMAAWWSLIKSTGGALNTVLKAGEQFGLEMVHSLDGIMQKWNEWMQTVEGQASLERFFTMARDSMKALVPILVGVRDAFSILVTPDAIERLASISESIGSVIPVIAQLLSILAQTGIVEAFFSVFAMLGEAIQPLMPLLTQLAGIISGTLGTILPIIGQAFKDIVTAIQPLLAALMPLIAELLPALVEAFAPIIDIIVQVVSAIAKGLTPIVEALTPIIAELAPVLVALFVAFNPVLRVLTVLGPLLSLIAEPLGKLIAGFLRLIEPVIGVVAAVAKFVIEFKAVGKVIDGILGIFGKVVGVFKGAGSAMSGFANTIKTAFSGTLEIIGNVGKVLFNIATFIPRMFIKMVQAIIGAFKSIGPAIMSVFDNIAATVGGFVARIVTPFKNLGASIGNAFAYIKEAIVHQLNQTWQAFSYFFSEIAAGLSGIVSSITTGMRMAFQTVVNVVRNVANAVGTVIGEIVGYFFSIPNKVKTAIQGIITAFNDVMRSAYNKVKEWIGKITGAFSNMWNGVKSKIPFFAAGGITTGPSVVGEAGPEMVIPLTRPLSQVDPSVRAIAAMLRGQGGDQVVQSGTTGPTKIVNNDIKVYSPSADPAAVAAQVVNRSVAMAM